MISADVKCHIPKFWNFAYVYAFCVIFVFAGGVVCNRTEYEVFLYNEVACTVECMDKHVLAVSTI